MGSQEGDHITTVYGGEEADEYEDSEDENLALRNNNQNDVVDEDDVDLVDDEEEEDDSMSSGVGEVTIAVAGLPGAASTAVAAPTTALTSTTVSVSPLPRSDIVVLEQQHRKIVPIDESRRLFQRLWTDEDEIELLQGFLDYTNQRLVNNPFHHHHHHDTTAFYDQIKDKLQLDFNKNQLVEKLRRLKKKYRNVLGKINSGKDYVFKSAHDQITFDISCKIWNNEANAAVSTPATADVARFDDEESNNPNPNPNLNLTFNLNEQNNGNGVVYPNRSEKKTPQSRKRSRSGGVKIEEKLSQQQQPSPPAVAVASNSSNSIPNLVEETVKSCLLPLFKELLEGSQNGQGRGFRGLGVGGMNLDPFGGLMNFSFGDNTDEKWRKQHILELEVCSKRLELVQDQIKSQLEELKSVKR
ncbi:hypothetical protein SSX86_019432 [Deinandra increscens subsp. villosa]|uniref:Glabrous enhancer-binding protein-like DBD domain-containing protein n=1 Tax=Deinandra increscens subsp. villosa TaxID=3103831 RepID=A0AAP0CSN9_9ASTR